jgi:hypothetical protein
MEYRGHAPAWDEVVIRGDTERREFLAFWIADGRVVAAMNANLWDTADSLADLVARQVPVSEIPADVAALTPAA